MGINPYDAFHILPVSDTLSPKITTLSNFEVIADTKLAANIIVFILFIY